MDYTYITEQLENNLPVFQGLLKSCAPEEYLWKPQPEKWCLLEIICHLCDEEREDFRMRVKTTLESPGTFPPPIDPVGWVGKRGYINQDFAKKLEEFAEERMASVIWLKSLKNPKWTNSYEHVSLGTVSAHLFLSNWLAHDYQHIRQILNIKHGYLQSVSGEKLDYAGNW
ncbi:MAG: DinB family protein [Cyclobacteriaceae bacterium]